MGKSDEKKKKEPNFAKIENGMIFTLEDKIIVGFPTEVETKTSAGGKLSILGGKAEGEKYTRIKYNWQVISGSPLPGEEMLRLKETIATTSGTIVASLGNASSIDAIPKCRKCGTSLFLVGQEFKCPRCGEPTIQL